MKTFELTITELLRRTSRDASVSTRCLKLLRSAWIGLSLAGCSVSEGSGWKLVSQLTDGLEVQFVEVAKEKAKSRATYDEAVGALCEGREICVVGFFQAGDSIPPAQDSRSFFTSGGFKDYRALTIWWSNRNIGLAEFSRWDCARAGADGAPLSALCGAGVAESYEALLVVAGWVGMAESCGWPPGDGKAAVAKFLTSMTDVDRRQMFKEGYDQLYGATRDGPDDEADCQRLRRKIEDRSRRARTVLKSLTAEGLSTLMAPSR